jgi:hypothetical protein
MAFPISPVNGQTTTVNGIRYIYASTTNTWSRIPSGKYTAAATGPSNPSTGDHWYNTSEDTLYEYVSDGVSSYWLDIQSAFVGGNAGSVISDTTIAGNLIPSANITYSLGSTTRRFKDLWLSGNTIILGNANISVDGTGSNISFGNANTFTIGGTVINTSGNTFTITNPGGGVFAVTGNTVTGTSSSTYGNITVSNTVTSGNLITTNGVFWANGAPFTSDPSGVAIAMSIVFGSS